MAKITYYNKILFALRALGGTRKFISRVLIKRWIVANYETSQYLLDRPGIFNYHINKNIDQLIEDGLIEQKKQSFKITQKGSKTIKNL